MAKEQAKAAEAQAKTKMKDDEQMTPEEQQAKLDMLQGLDQGDEELAAKAEEVDPFESIPHVYPGKPGFEEGKTYKGVYLRTKRIYSDNFNNPKIEKDTGEAYRDLHILHNKKANVTFGIWSVGQLGPAFRVMPEGAYVEVTYTGLGEVLKAGQSQPHTFKFKACNPDGSRITFDWDRAANPSRNVPTNETSARN